MSSIGWVTSVLGAYGSAGQTGDGLAAFGAVGGDPQAISVGPDGILYVADTSRNFVYRLQDGGTRRRIAGTVGTSGAAGDNDIGIKTGALLNGPTGLVASPSGSLFIIDGGNNKIRMLASSVAVAPHINNDAINIVQSKSIVVPTLSNDLDTDGAIDPSTALITSSPTKGTLGAFNPLNGWITYTSTGTTGTDTFTYKACDTTRILCSTATVTVTIVATPEVQTIAGGVTESGGSPGGANGINGLPNNVNNTSSVPEHVARSGNYLYMYDRSMNVIRRLDLYTNQVVTVAGNGTSPGLATYVDTGVATAATVGRVSAISVLPDGSIIFADDITRRVRLISLDGTIRTIAGNGLTGTPNTGTAATTSAGIIFGLGVARDGRIFVGNAGSVRSFTLNGTWSLVAGTGTTGFSGDTGLATSAKVNTISSIAFDAAQNIYLADHDNESVRRITVADSKINTIMGLGNNVGLTGLTGAAYKAAYPDGALATSQPLSAPNSVGIGADGNVYVLDSTINIIRKFSVGGTMTTVAGGGTSRVDGSTAITSSFAANDFTFDATGTGLFISNYKLPITVAEARVRWVNVGGTVYSVTNPSRQIGDAAYMARCSKLHDSTDESKWSSR